MTTAAVESIVEWPGKARTTLDAAIRFVRKLFGTTDEVVNEYDAQFFVTNACQYYAAARFAMNAQCNPVCGNLFHHAVEMFLKGGLARKRPLSELQDMRHNLKKIWRAFKADFPGASLSRHDKTIKSLDKFEEIRYPGGAMKSIGISLEWAGPAGTITTYGGISSPRKYSVIVSDLDHLVADVLRASSWNPGVFMGSNPAALEAITRYNDHAEYLTTRF